MSNGGEKPWVGQLLLEALQEECRKFGTLSLPTSMPKKLKVEKEESWASGLYVMEPRENSKDGKKKDVSTSQKEFDTSDVAVVGYKTRPTTVPQPTSQGLVACVAPSQPLPRKIIPYTVTTPKPVEGTIQLQIFQNFRPQLFDNFQQTTEKMKDPLILTKQPEPQPTYMANASHQPKRLKSPQSILIVSDLNGTLIFRNHGVKFHQRPGLGDFLDYIYKTHTVMIWTSARPENCVQVCQTLLTKPQHDQTVAIWARDTLGLTPKQYNSRVSVFKRLEKVWEDENIQRSHPQYETGGRWSQKNTLLLDDSTYKAAAQPFNLVHIPELTRETLQKEMKSAEKEREALLAAGARKAMRAEPPEFKAFRHAAATTPAAKKRLALIMDEADDAVAPPNQSPYHAVLRQVAGYLEEAKWWEDVSGFSRLTPFKMGAGWEVKGKEEVPRVGGEATLTVNVR